jgi:hypothetical protein
MAMMHASWCVDEWHPTRGDCTCGAERVWRLRTLAHNLAWAATLCRAFKSGFYIGARYTGIDQTWRPGCGKEAP